MKRKIRVAILVFLVIFILACGSGAAATPTPNLEATMGAAVADDQSRPAGRHPQPTQPQVDLQATVDAQVQLTMAAQQAAQPAPEQPPPEQPSPPDPVQPEPVQPSGDMAATAQAQPMYDFVNWHGRQG